MGGSALKIIATHEQIVHQSTANKCHRLGKFLILSLKTNSKSFRVIKIRPTNEFTSSDIHLKLFVGYQLTI